VPQQSHAYYRPIGTKGDYLRVEFTTDGAKVLGFVVQLEVVVQGMLRPAIRFDTAHGFPHVDILNPRGRLIEKKPLSMPLKQALTFAIDDIKVNWDVYRARFIDMARSEP
jgi:hypothetical protein